MCLIFFGGLLRMCVSMSVCLYECEEMLVGRGCR